MSLFSTLNTGVTGLGVNSTTLAVTGDNLANLNTIGFKGSRAQFQDLLISNIGGASRTSQLGMGSFLGGVAQQFTQGSVTTTGRTSDMAIDGAGFFVVASQEGTFYTRDGGLTLDNESRLVTLGGYVLQGYMADATGTIGSSLGDIQLTPDTLSPSATTSVTMNANLDADADIASAIWGTGALPTDPNQAASEATYTTSMTVYDSLGAEHEVIIYFQKTNTNEWNYHIAVDDGELGGTAGQLTEIESGTLQFDTDGSLQSQTVATTAYPITFVGADAQTLTFDMGDPTGAMEGAVTQFASDSTVTGLDQDGYGAGNLIDWQMDSDGVISGVYSNGETRVLGQVALALFSSVDGLERAGDNLYMATTDSGQPLVGAAETGGRGSVYQYALEGSNVDMESEFVAMITAQRGYQASSRVISASDDLLKELVNIV